MSGKTKIFSTIEGTRCVVETRTFSMSGTTAPESVVSSIDIDSIKQKYCTKLCSSIGQESKKFNVMRVLDNAFSEPIILNSIQDIAKANVTEDEIVQKLMSEKPGSLSELDFSNIEDDNFEVESKTFSVSSIRERLRINSLNPKMRLKNIFLDYSRFLKSSQKMSTEEMNEVKELFNSDFMNLLSSVASDLTNGGNLISMLGLQNYSTEVTEAARVFAPLYKKAIIIESSTGDVPKAMYEKLSNATKEMINALQVYVFNELINNPDLLELQDALNVE